MVSPYVFPGVPFKVRLDIASIKTATSKVTGIPVDAMDVTTRKREVVEARQLAMYIGYRYTKLSLKEVGYVIGRKDHATVLHARRNIQNLLDARDPHITKYYYAIINELEKSFILKNIKKKF